MAKPTEQVRATVTESAGLGGDANDDYGVPADIDPTEDVLVAAGIFFGAPGNAQPSDGTVAIYIDPADGKLYFEDIDNLGPGARRTLADLVAGVGGLTIEAHKAIRQLIHFISDGPAEGFATGAFKETTGTVFPTFVAWYVAGSTPPAGLIVSLTVTWTGIVPTTEVWKMYDTDGSTILVTVTDTISYSGIFETSRTRAIA
jgi:hypothetical protein